jgi:inorganic pyrophosphatase
LRARPIGGLRLIDRGEADDKIIAVMRGECGKCYHCEKKEGLREKVEIELLGRRVLNK